MINSDKRSCFLEKFQQPAMKTTSYYYSQWLPHHERHVKLSSPRNANYGWLGNEILLNLWDCVFFCLLSSSGWNWLPFSGQNWYYLLVKSLKFELSKLCPWDSTGDRNQHLILDCCIFYISVSFMDATKLPICAEITQLGWKGCHHAKFLQMKPHNKDHHQWLWHPSRLSTMNQSLASVVMHCSMSLA